MRPWQYAGSVFDGFSPAPRRDPASLRKVVVTLGTIKRYGFRAWSSGCCEILPPRPRSCGRPGSTDVSDYPIEGRRALPAHEMDAAMRDADLVIAHAGVGSSLAAIRVGPRAGGGAAARPPGRARGRPPAADRGELDRRELAVAREVDELTLADLERAARARVHRTADPAAARAGRALIRRVR